MTWLDFLTDALIDIGVIGPGDTIDAPVIDVSLRHLNRILNRWQGLRRYAYNLDFPLYTLTPNHSPTLIGPGLTSPDFATTNGVPRPTRIEGADLVLNSSNPSTDQPINIRDDAWWLNQRVKSITSTIPTDLYYSPGFPNGALYFWPIPAVAYQVRLEVQVALGTVSADDLETDFSAPQTYEDALLLTLEERLVIPFGKIMPADLPRQAREARAALQSNNVKSPRIASADFGTGAGGLNGGGGFNWRSGMPS